MAFKPMIFDYQSKALTTGLADVKAQVYKNTLGTRVASNVALVELDATNAPGNYTLSISGANLSTWGFANGDTLIAVIDSASKPAQSAVKSVVTSISTDDLDAHLTTQDSSLSSISSSVSTVNSNVLTVKSDVEDATTGLAAIKTAINSLSAQVLTIQNTVLFSASVPELVKPSSGSTLYRVPIRIYDEKGNMADPDSNAISVTLYNTSGVDRGAILTGYSAGSAPAVRVSQGVYQIDLSLPAGATEEELVFSFLYARSSVSFNQARSGTVLNNVQADGFAQQSTLLSVQSSLSSVGTNVSQVLSDVESASFGLSAIKSAVDSKASQASVTAVASDVSAIKGDVESVSTGLAAIKSAVDLKSSQSSVDSANSSLSALQTDVTSNVKGSGFDVSLDTLHQLGLYLRANAFQGGRAI